MRLGYNTNGFAHHDLLEAIDVLGQLGYQSVALTLDHQALNPFAPDCPRQIAQVQARLEQYGMANVIETGARFLLDPWQKHEPTLVSAASSARQRRIDFLCRAVDIAAQLGSDCVSLWSGIVRDDCSAGIVWDRLVEGLTSVLAYAERVKMPIGFEPEPGMFIDSMTRFERLTERVQAQNLYLTLDIGHLHCLGEQPIPELIRRWGPQMVNVHLEDMREGQHEHLMFGEGEMDFPPILQALREAGYRYGVHVELSRHSHEAPLAARRARDFLVPLLRAEE